MTFCRINGRQYLMEKTETGFSFYSVETARRFIIPNECKLNNLKIYLSKYDK